MNLGEPVSSGRLRYVDIAKGIAIIAVIVGHVAMSYSSKSAFAWRVEAACFTFHMPLFFMLSGYFLKPDKYSFKRDARHLIVPYVVGGCTIALAATIVTMWLQDADSAVGPIRQLLRWLNAVAFGAGFLPGNPLWHQTKYIGGLWFLLALFWARLIVATIDRHIRPLALRLAVVVGLAVAGVLTAKAVWLPWSIQAGMCAAMFVWSGSRLRDLNAPSGGEARLRRSGAFWVVAVTAWIVSIGVYSDYRVSNCILGTSLFALVWNMIGSYAGSACVVGGSRLIESHLERLSQVLAALGRNTLLILFVHIFELDVVRWYIPRAQALAVFPHPGWIFLCDALIRVVIDCCMAGLLARSGAVRELVGGKR